MARITHLREKHKERWKLKGSEVPRTFFPIFLHSALPKTISLYLPPMSGLCICDIIQTTPEYLKDDWSDDYVDNPTALSLLITLTGADVFKTGDSGQLPYEFVGDFRLYGMQEVLWRHMTDITRTTYMDCLGDSQATLTDEVGVGIKLLERAYNVEKGLAELVVSFIRPPTKLSCDEK